jgi:hypothetical protein
MLRWSDVVPYLGERVTPCELRRARNAARCGAKREPEHPASAGQSQQMHDAAATVARAQVHARRKAGSVPWRHVSAGRETQRLRAARRPES